VKACCKLAREFVAEGFDVAIDDVLYPGTAFDESWRRELDGLDWRMVIVQPSLEETLRRSAAREKHVPPSLTEEQHKAIRDWPDWVRVDTTDQAVDESLSVIERVIAQTPPEAV
jgi:chloramphenicol 3-O-phosphotransferase